MRIRNLVNAGYQQKNKGIEEDVMVVIKTDIWILWQKYPISDIHESIIQFTISQ